jgi:hypothetical protein
MISELACCTLKTAVKKAVGPELDLPMRYLTYVKKSVRSETNGSV